MHSPLKIAAILLIAVILAAAALFVLAGPQRFWGFFGNRDLGPISFSTLVRRTTPNDSLACPAGACTATVDITTPAYGVPATILRKQFSEALAEEPNLEKVASDDGTLTDRYIQSTPLMGFPDTIVVQFIDLPDARSSLMIYSRSKFGRSDLGANRERLERWLKRLSEKMQAGGA